MTELSCPTCNRSTYAPCRNYNAAGKLTEACCDMSHEPYIAHVGAEYRTFYYDFWRKADAKAAEIRARRSDLAKYADSARFALTWDDVRHRERTGSPYPAS